MILLADKIEKSFGDRVLYSGATLQVNAGERYALVGPNGAGKTTFLKIIMGIEVPDQGTVTYAKGVQIGYLEQESSLAQNRSAIDEVLASAEEIQALGRRAEELQLLISTAKDNELSDLLDEYGRVQDRFEHCGGYELESKARQILAGLGFRIKDFDRPCSEFSGGWQMRISLAKLLLRRPDLLLLDEPTNHLDLESVQWLRDFLSNYEGAVVLVSHDRVFMDACVSHVAAVENRRLTTYVGNYSKYLKQREDNLEQMRAKREAQERDIAHMQTFVDRFRYKPTKKAQVQERIKRIEQIKKELVIIPAGHKTVTFKFPDPPRSGDMVVSLEHAGKTYISENGKTNEVYKDINLTLYRGERIALVGPNGAGKSTLLKMIAGVEQLSCGTKSLGTNVGVAYYAQHALEGLNESHTVLQEIDSVAPKWTVPQERSLLGKFLFHGDAVEKKVSVLSGGERARLALAKMLVAPEALLCLDEPTKHLDIDSVDMIEQALNAFPGTLVLISHDEHLVRNVANKIDDVRDGSITVYDGDYEYYLWKREDLADRAAGGSGKLGPAHEEHRKNDTKSNDVQEQCLFEKSSINGPKTKEQKRAEAQARKELNKKLRGRRKRLEEIESALEPARKRYDELMQIMASDELYANPSKFEAAMDEYTSLKKKIPLLEEEWLNLSEEIEEATSHELS